MKNLSEKLLEAARNSSSSIHEENYDGFMQNLSFDDDHSIMGKSGKLLPNGDLVLVIVDHGSSDGSLLKKRSKEIAARLKSEIKYVDDKFKNYEFKKLGKFDDGALEFIFSPK